MHAWMHEHSASSHFLENVKENILTNGLQAISEEDKNNLLNDSSVQVLVYFSPFIPLEFLAPERVYGDDREEEIKEIIMAENESSWHLFLRAENGTLLSSALQLDETFRENLSLAQGLYYTQLPNSFSLDLTGDCEKQLGEQIEKETDIYKDPAAEENAEEINNGLSEEEKEGDSPEENEENEENELTNEEEDSVVEVAEVVEEVEEVEEEEEEDIREDETPEHIWEIETKGNLFVPEEELEGVEIVLEKEDIPIAELVQAFFFDPSMARRIEERDEALFFTDGERGLRIYPNGLVEYAAPMLERGLSTISYSSALNKGAESQSLYGGWQDGSYLVESNITEKGYRFRWSPVFNGFPLDGENSGSEMLVNEQGVPFYSRYFFIVRNNKESSPFKPYAEALCEALSLNKDQFEDQKATLLSLRPVMYVVSEENKRAVPAWKVVFEETEVIYLHWRSLEELS